MNYIHNKGSFVQKALAPRNDCVADLKWSQYVLLVDTADGCLAWNTLTSVLVLLEGITVEGATQDIDTLTDKEALFNASFLVPADMDEAKRLSQFSTVLDLMREPIKSNGYSIFTTLGCNARCPYCFEKDMPKFPMSEKVALDTVKFIKQTSKCDKVNLHWFGGEPLVNVNIIDLISENLSNSGVEYASIMYSNGYLFDEDMVRRAVDLWKLKHVQITLDGTEEVYNRTKNYVNANGSPYKRVLDNIDLLADKGIRVNIRLNLSLDNADNLMTLAEELAKRFSGKDNITVYSMPLYEYFQTATDETAEGVFDKYSALTNLLIENQIYGALKLPSNLQQNHCMADNDSAYGILPDGRLDKCRDERAMETVGDIWNGITDTEKVEWFKQRVPKTEKCNICFYAPTCTLLTACTRKCGTLHLLKEKYDLESRMKSTYRKWKEENK